MIEEFKDNPEWTDKQHSYYYTLYLLKHNPDETDISEAIELLEFVGSP